MAVVSVPTPRNYPIRFNSREAKVIETAIKASGIIQNKYLDSSCTIVDATDNAKVLAFDMAEMTTAKTFTLTPKSNVNSEFKVDLTGSTTAKYLSLAAAVSDNRVVTIPDATDTLVMLDQSQVLTNKSLESSCSIVDVTNNTKVLAFDISGMTASKTLTLIPISDQNNTVKIDLSGSTATKYLSLKSVLTADRVLSLPDATDTLVGKATTDTFTNKTFDADGTGNSITNIEDANIKAAAAIAVNKLAALTASKAVVSDGSGFLASSAVTSTQIGYLSGLGGTLTTGGAWTQTGAHTIGFTTSGATALSLPTSGTLATLAGSEVLENKVLEDTCALVDTTDNTKTIKWNLAAQSPGVDYTITSGAEAADRIINIPVLGADQTLVFANLAQTLASKTLTSPVINTQVSGSAFLDEDNMASDSDVKLASQQSIKAYVDNRIAYPIGSAVQNFAKDGFVICGPNAMADGAGSYDDSAAAINQLISRNNIFEMYNGTVQTIGPAWLKGSGLNIAGDQVDNECWELGMGCLTTDDVVRTVGTSNCYMRAKLTIADASGTDNLRIGWRKVQAYQADPLVYTDYASIGFDANADPNDIKILTDLNNVGEVSTDTTSNLSDGQYIDVKIYVGDEAYLQTGIDLANAVKASFNGHIADQSGTPGADEHIADHGAIATGNASTTATLITLVTDLMAKYVAHNADAVLVTPVYHQATGGGDALASEVAPTNLSECIAKLNDLKAKLNLHYADNVAHSAGDTALIATVDMCNTYFQLGVNGALADPATTVAFNFDTSDEIVPFINMIQHGDLTEAVYVSNFEVMDVVTATV